MYIVLLLFGSEWMEGGRLDRDPKSVLEEPRGGRRDG